MNQPQTEATATSIEDLLREFSPEYLVLEGERVVGVRVTEEGVTEHLRWLCPTLRNGLAPEMTEVIALSFVQLLAFRQLRRVSRHELETVMTASGLPYRAEFVYQLLRRMPWVTQEPDDRGERLVIGDLVWTTVAKLIAQQGIRNS
ncbi:MAG: hypothetical protein JO247_14945 [Chloroflexi bacterium]|nr:hypothetical protein [Chloroflexota bacterium]